MTLVDQCSLTVKGKKLRRQLHAKQKHHRRRVQVGDSESLRKQLCDELPVEHFMGKTRGELLAQRLYVFLVVLTEVGKRFLYDFLVKLWVLL